MPEKLLVALCRNHAFVICASGRVVEELDRDIEWDDVFDYDGEERAYGLWVWEGAPGFTTDYYGEADGPFLDRGSLREPTDEEWSAIRRQERPWPSVHDKGDTDAEGGG